MKDLNQTDKAVLAFIERHYREHYQPPTVRQIMDNTKLSSTSSVNYCLGKLTDRGLIRRVDRKPVPVSVIRVLGYMTPAEVERLW